MKEYRLMWEPKADIDLNIAATQVKKYMDDEATFALFECGTCLMLKEVEGVDKMIHGAMKEARKILDFKVYPMNDGDFLVFFASPLLVYVGKEEFYRKREEIKQRVNELKFEMEDILSVAKEGDVKEDLLVGLYARGKLQRDAWSNLKFKIISPG